MRLQQPVRHGRVEEGDRRHVDEQHLGAALGERLRGRPAKRAAVGEVELSGERDLGVSPWRLMSAAKARLPLALGDAMAMSFGRSLLSAFPATLVALKPRRLTA